MPVVKFFFLGYPVDQELAGAIDNCDASDRQFLEDPAYLDTIFHEETKYIGRRLGDSLSLEQASDTARNVVSLITRVVPEWKGRAAASVLLALEEEETTGVFLTAE